MMSGATPVPDSAAVCGLPAALSLTVIDADRDPLIPGVKVMLMVHVAEAARLPGQLLVCSKSEAFVPVTLMLEMVSATLPELVTVKLCGALVLRTN